MKTAQELQRASELNMTNGSTVDEMEAVDPAELEVQKLCAELHREQELRLRLAAEFGNYRRRVRQERAQAAAEGKRKLLEQLIAMVDDMDLALKHLDGPSDSVAEAFRLLHRQFQVVLESHAVVAFESEGEIFDPERHEAFAVAQDEGHGSGTVQKQLRKGYFWDGRLFRPALVVVAQ
jgi:molecular chaperone GrpE